MREDTSASFLSGTLIRVGRVRLTDVRLDLTYPGAASLIVKHPTASFKAAAKLADELFANSAGGKGEGSDVCYIGTLHG